MMRLIPSLLAALTLGACTGSETKDQATTGQEGEFPRDSLVVAWLSDADTLLYVVAQSASDSNVIGMLAYDGLRADFDCGLKYLPAIYKSWDLSEDGKTLKIEMRDDIKWADGVTVTAQDVAFTYDLVADPLVASPRLAQIERMEKDARPLVIDDTHLEFHFTEAYDRTTQLAHATLPLAPKHIIEKLDRATLRGADYTRNPMTYGPWKIGKWDRGQSIVMEPNEKWTGPAELKPKIKRVIFKVIPEYATRLIELENGSVDMMEAIQVADADRLAKEHPEIKLYRRGWRSQDYIAWNELDPEAYKAAATKAAGGEIDLTKVKPNALFADKDVRRALGRAINVDKLIKDLLTSSTTGEVYGVRSVSTLTPALCDYKNDEIVPLPYEMEVAKSELAAAGWKDSNGDGILDKNGVKFSFKLLTNAGNARRSKAAVIVQANLKDIGIEMQIEQVESNSFFERLRKKDYEAALSGWSAGLFVDPTDLWHSGSKYEFNFTSYSNPRVDELIESGMREPDPAKAIPIWKEMQKIIYDEQPYAFLYWMDEIVGVNERFQDVKVDILSPYTDIEGWWVPADKVKYKN